MKPTLTYDSTDSITHVSGGCPNVNGIRKIKFLKFMNKELEIARDLWLLSFYLMGLDIREILQAKPDNVMEGVYICESPNEMKIPLPLCDEAFAIFQKYQGTYYALNIIERDYTPSFKEAFKKANRICINLNNKLQIIKNFNKFNCHLTYEDVRLAWILNAKDFKLDVSVINKMSDFTANPHGRVYINGNIEKIAKENQKFLDFILRDLREENKPKEYPIKQEDGSLLWYED